MSGVDEIVRAVLKLEYPISSYLRQKGIEPEFRDLVFPWDPEARYQLYKCGCHQTAGFPTYYVRRADKREEGYCYNCKGFLGSLLSLLTELKVDSAEIAKILGIKEGPGFDEDLDEARDSLEQTILEGEYPFPELYDSYTFEKDGKVLVRDNYTRENFETAHNFEVYQKFRGRQLKDVTEWIRVIWELMQSEKKELPKEDFPQIGF
jgi:hypothetical protein